MALTKETIVDKIEVLEKGQVQVPPATPKDNTRAIIILPRCSII